jgi:hypothetical protein
MDVIGVEEMGPGLDQAVNTEERLPENKEDETKETYKSYKYVFTHSLQSSFEILMTSTSSQHHIATQQGRLLKHTANMSSIRKKYRKMKFKFDEAMKLSNELYTQEQNAENTAKRIAHENE